MKLVLMLAQQEGRIGVYIAQNEVGAYRTQ